MNNQKSRPLFSLAAFTLAAFLVACTTDESSTPAPVPADQPPPAPTYLRFSEKAPPAAQMEMKPALDIRTQIWRPGHWTYDNGQFNWVPGEVMQKPTFTAVWSPDRWEKHTYGWAFISGHWQ
jgi:hypothetical protein